MKKFFVIALLVSIFSTAVFAEASNINLTSEKNESKWSSLTYYNVPIVKVLDSRDAYVVIYQKNKLGTGSTVIPKTWAKGTPETPRKLKFRNTKNPAASFMTVVKKDGEFHRVILTMPLKKNNNLWGVVKSKVPGSDKDTLEELDLY